MRISDWSSDVCSSDLAARHRPHGRGFRHRPLRRRRHGPCLNHRCLTPGASLMPTIARIDVSHHRLPLDPPFVASWDGRPRRHFDVTVVRVTDRSEEHTSELQSLMRISYAVFCLKKKTETTKSIQIYQ